jgi:hypothetical protein
MEFKKTLLEAKENSPEVKEFMDTMSKVSHPFMTSWIRNYEKALKEGEIEIGALRGQTTADAVLAGPGMQVYATLEIFNAVIRGFTRYMDDSFVRKYVTDSVIFKIPKTEYRELVASISAGELPHTEKMIDYATVNLSTPESERGGKVTWTRALLEDITFDVQAEMAEGLGHAIAVRIMKDILDAVVAVQASQMPYGQNRTISSPITWAEFLAVIGDVDVGVEFVSVPWDAGTDPAVTDIGKPVNDDDALVGYLVGYELGTGTTGTLYIALTKVKTAIADNSDIDIVGGTGANLIASAASTSLGKRTYGPADFCLVSPDVYWQLLNIIQMTNVLYEGSTDPVKKGVIKLALGTTIVKQSLLPTGTIVALNSEKAIALVTRRALKIEPVIFPVWNEYGFIGTVRYGTTVIYGSSIQIGQIA